MSRVRAEAGRLLRRVGTAARPPGPFTPQQLEQLHAIERDIDAAARAREPGGAAPAPAANLLDSYTQLPPSPQLAVDLFAGDWSSALPAELGVEAGHAKLFADDRIGAVLDWLGDGVEGMSVLELGPLEGGHTYMLDRAGAQVTAVESNSRAYLKCLIAKELLAMRNARFLRGDFTAYLRDEPAPVDLVLASGVLYHMVDPGELLSLMAGVSSRLAIWTHYFDAAVVMAGASAHQFQADPVAVRTGDATYLLHPRDYLDALGWGGFCGGPETFARWMERGDILDLLGRLGFDDIEIAFDQPDHVNGPCFLLLARRSDAARAV
jgi:hypothetical protein